MTVRQRKKLQGGVAFSLSPPLAFFRTHPGFGLHLGRLWLTWSIPQRTYLGSDD